MHKIAPRGVYTSGKGSSAVGLTAYITRDPDSKQLVLERYVPCSPFKSEFDPTVVPLSFLMEVYVVLMSLTRCRMRPDQSCTKSWCVPLICSSTELMCRNNKQSPSPKLESSPHSMPGLRSSQPPILSTRDMILNYPFLPISISLLRLSLDLIFCTWSSTRSMR